MPLNLQIPSPLSLVQREILHHQLDERLRVLRRELSEAVHPPAAAGTAQLRSSRGEADDAVADLELDLDVASIERDARELAEVVDALRRIDAGVFGVCAECGEPIDWQRLRVLPQARHCAGCATLAERASYRPAGTRL